MGIAEARMERCPRVGTRVKESAECKKETQGTLNKSTLSFFPSIEIMQIKNPKPCDLRFFNFIILIQLHVRLFE